MARFFGKRQVESADSPIEAEIDVVRAVRAQAPGRDVVFGAPSRCPECGDFGFVDGVDQAAGRCENHCVRCGAAWTITRRALRAAGPVSDEPTVPVGAGSLLEGLAGDRERVEVSASPMRADDDLRLLLVEDDPADAELMRTVLSPGDHRIKVVHVQTRGSAERAVAERGPFDVVLLDLGLPDSTGLTTLAQWRATGDPAPVVVLSGNDLPDLAAATRREGAAGFMHKRELMQLGGAGKLIGELRALAAPARR